MIDQSNISRLSCRNTISKPTNRAEVLGRISSLSDAQFGIVAQFVRQVLSCHDPDVVHSFVEWRHDPIIGSILSIAADLDEDHREQLLYLAEDILRQQSGHTPVQQSGVA